MLRIGNPTMGCGMHFEVAIGTVLPRAGQRMVLHRHAGTSNPLLRTRHTGGTGGTAGPERNAGSRFSWICMHGKPVSLGSVLYEYVPKNRMFWSHRGIRFQYYQTSHHGEPRSCCCLLIASRSSDLARAAIASIGTVWVSCSVYSVLNGHLFTQYIVDSLTAVVGHGKSYQVDRVISANCTEYSVFCTEYSVLRLLQQFCATLAPAAAEPHVMRKQKDLPAFSAKPLAYSYTMYRTWTEDITMCRAASVWAPCDALTQHALSNSSSLLIPRLPAGRRWTSAARQDQPRQQGPSRALGLCGAAARRLIRHRGRRAPSRTKLGPPPSLA